MVSDNIWHQNAALFTLNSSHFYLPVISRKIAQGLTLGVVVAISATWYSCLPQEHEAASWLKQQLQLHSSRFISELGVWLVQCHPRLLADSSTIPLHHAITPCPWVTIFNQILPYILHCLQSFLPVSRTADFPLNPIAHLRKGIKNLGFLLIHTAQCYPQSPPADYIVSPFLWGILCSKDILPNKITAKSFVLTLS